MKFISILSGSRHLFALIPLALLVTSLMAGCTNQNESAAGSEKKLEQARREGMSKTLNDPTIPESVKAQIRAHGAPPPPPGTK